MKIAFIDPFGQSYTGYTLEFRGLGGSESSVIYMSRELAALGHEVKVFNHCVIPEMQDKVAYIPIREADKYADFDVVIVLRTVMPFVTDPARLSRGISFPSFRDIIDTAKYKALWKHDTYCDGDNELADLLKAGIIDEVFTLSDWHTNHTMEKLNIPRDKIWQTRNGYQHYPVNLRHKKSKQFVYNAAYYKGLEGLLTDIWPEIIKQYPKAELVVIGGYYDGFNDSNKTSIDVARQKGYENVSFTGVIPPARVAAIMAESKYFLHPCTFPETFGISTLEAIAYETFPIVTPCGALETTALPGSSIKVPLEKFTKTVLEVLEHNITTTKLLNMHEYSWGAVAKEWDAHLVKPVEKSMKILIAVPTAVRIECETFKSIYDLKIPEGYEVDFQFFWCYMVDQGRNEIANYAIQNGYDYLFGVDADIEVPADALVKMLAHDKDYVSGMYRMRRPQQHIEVYDTNYVLYEPEKLKEEQLLEVGGSGAGCALIKTSMLKDIGYPQYYYHQAYKFSNTFSEDMDMCRKARNKGYKLYCDTSIRCRHKGTVMWQIEL